MKKLSLLLSIFVLLSLTACDGPSLSGKTVEKKYYTGGGLQSEYIMDDKSRKNGILKKYGYNGKLTSAVYIRNGVKSGMETWYDPHGRTIRQRPYANGRIHGTARELYQNGDTMVTIPYQNGVRNGKAYKYNKDGSVYQVVIFRNDKIIN